MNWPRKILAVLSPRWRPPSTCEACGGAFTCGATLTGCWCSEIKVPADTRTEQRARYSRCLCRPCLGRAATVEREQ